MLEAKLVRKYRAVWITSLAVLVLATAASVTLIVLNARRLTYQSAMFLDATHPELIENGYKSSIQWLERFGTNNSWQQATKLELAKWLWHKKRCRESTNILNALLASDAGWKISEETKRNACYLLGSNYWYEKDFSKAAEQFEESLNHWKQMRQKPTLSEEFDLTSYLIRALLRSSQFQAADDVTAKLQQLVSSTDTTEAKRLAS